MSATALTDAQPHRGELPAFYNRYSRCSDDLYYTPETEALQSLFRPLFATSWLIDDLLGNNCFFGAKVVVLSSASSKTAYGTAYQLAQRGGVEIVGLTSETNRSFCEDLGFYDRVVSYEELEAMGEGLSVAYVDFAGDAKPRARIHSHFADLKCSYIVGATHLARTGETGSVAGPKPTMFCAPSQSAKRAKEWGAAELNARIAADWKHFCPHVERPPDTLRIVRNADAETARQVYSTLAAGLSSPQSGHMLLMACD